MIAIVDYGMGNLRSVQKALQRVGGDARIVSSTQELARASKVVLPGVGAFGEAMQRLRAQGLVEPLVRSAGEGTPFLAICLGLQLLFDVSYEGGEHAGLGVFPGKVVLFEFAPGQGETALPVPHMGWNSLRWNRPCPILNGLQSGEYAYFAHSYYVVPQEDAVVCTTTDYGRPFVSSVWRDNVFASQFHPEKSQAAGLRMLENFVRL